MNTCEIALRWMPRTPLMTSQFWFRLWLGTVRQQAVTWDNAGPDLCHHMAILWHTELTAYAATKVAKKPTFYFPLLFFLEKACQMKATSSVVCTKKCTTVPWNYCSLLSNVFQFSTLENRNDNMQMRNFDIHYDEELIEDTCPQYFVCLLIIDQVINQTDTNTLYIDCNTTQLFRSSRCVSEYGVSTQQNCSS